MGSAPVEVIDVGAKEDPNARPVRIVHISDTHGRHFDYLPDLPSGDVLVHSGDFGCYAFKKLFRRGHYFRRHVRELNAFFAQCAINYKHVVFTPGNHELHFPGRSTQSVQALLPNCHYLQDTSVTLEGIKFYGAGWNGKRLTSFAGAFSVGYGKTLGRHWDGVPDDVDVMVTHTPPSGVMDLSLDKSLFKDTTTCKVCGKTHPGLWHWGCEYLKQTLVNKVRPKLHLFGHCHENNGIVREEGIVFSNAAMKFHQRPRVFDFYVCADR